MDLSKVWEWALHEVREVRRAPIAIVVLLVMGFILGWLAASGFYAERMEVLTLQRDSALAGRPAMPPPSPPLSQQLPSLNVIVGAVGGLCVFVSLLLFRSNRNKRVEAKWLLGRIDALQESVSEGLRANEKIADEKTKAEIALKDRRHQYAMEVLERYSNARFKDDIKPRVTIRYCSYGQDYVIAQKIEAMFTQYVRWSVTKDASNNPALPRSDQFKVVFDVGMTVLTYGDLVHAFMEGDLLGVTVGMRQYTEREDSENLIVLVLPSAEK